MMLILMLMLMLMVIQLERTGSLQSLQALVNQQSFGKGTAAARWMKACFTGGVSSIEQAKTAVWGQGSLVWHASKLALVGKPRGQGANKMKKSIQKNFKRIIRMFLHNDACRNFAYVNSLAWVTLGMT